MTSTDPPPTEDANGNDPARDDPTGDHDRAVDNSFSGIMRRLGPAGVLGILWAALPALGGFYLLARLGPVSQWLAEQGNVGVAIYACLFAVLAGLGLLPTYAQAVAGGWTFGLATGTAAALLGFTGAAVIGFVVARLISSDRAERVIHEHARAQAVRGALIGSGFWRTLLIVTLVRVPPNSPFALTNLVMAASGVRIGVYTLGTLLGMAPRTAVAVGFAAAAAKTGATDIQAFVKEGPGTFILIGGLVVMFIVLAIIARIANAAIARVVEREEPTSAGAAE